MTRPAVTIAMPVRNGGRDVRLAVQSILDQTYENWELILIDDGSTDGSISALHDIDDPRVRIISDGQSRGLAARLNQIVVAATAPLIARMDHDDIAHPDRVRQQVEFMAGNPAVDLLGTHCLSMSEEEQIVGELPFAQTHAEICRRPWLGFHLAHPSWMGRTDWFRRNLYADPAPYSCEDQELLLRAHSTSRYDALPNTLLAYRIRNRVPFAKLFRTRSAWVRVQLAYFTSAGRYLEAALAVAAFGLRICSDVARQAFPRLRSDRGPLGSTPAVEWQAVITALQKKLGR